MRRTSWMILMGMLLWTFAAAARAAPASPPDEAAMLAAENKALRAQVVALRKEVARLKGELARLKAPRIQPTTSATTEPTSKPWPKPGEYSYRGKVRTEAWFDRMYARCAYHIVVLEDGKFRDVARDVLMPLWIGWDAPPIGSVRWSTGSTVPGTAKILQVLSNGDAIVRVDVMGTTRDVFFHVQGGGVDNIDGAEFPRIHLVYRGPYSYTSTTGARTTIQSYQLHRRLTRKEFAAALASGFRLNLYKAVKTRSARSNIWSITGVTATPVR